MLSQLVLRLWCALGGRAWLAISPVQPQQLSCLGMQSLDAGALSEDVWAHAWVPHVVSPSGGQAQGHGPRVTSVLSPQFYQPHC